MSKLSKKEEKRKKENLTRIPRNLYEKIFCNVVAVLETSSSCHLLHVILGFYYREGF